MEENTKPRPTEAEYLRYMELSAQSKNNENFSEELTEVMHEIYNTKDLSPEIFEVNGKYGLKNPIGAVLLPAVFEEIKTLSGFPIEKGERIVAMQKGKYGIAITGDTINWLVEPLYDDIGYPNNITHVCLNGKWGVLNIVTGAFIIPPECDRIFEQNGIMFMNGIGIFEKDGKYGVIDRNCNFTAAIFEEVDPSDAYVAVKLNGKWGYINEANEFTEDVDGASYYCEM